MPMWDKKYLSITFLVAIFSLLIASGCGDNSKIPPPPKIMPVQPIPAPAPVEEKPKAVYMYEGDKYRDIFTPAGSVANYQSEAVFDPQKATVRGIIYSTRLKSAVLNVVGSGSYFVKDGKVIDIMGKAIKGITAKVLRDRVILTNESENTFEIKLKNDDEEAKSL
jgi:hypothetical protein